MDTPVVSTVLPVYNERELLRAAVGEIRAKLEETGLPFEIVAVNDGSSDGSAAIIDALAAEDDRFVAVHFSRNFGKEAAMSAGLEAAKGGAVLLMDTDLQHPPALIPELVKRWQEGFDVVDAVKRDRGSENPVYGGFARLFYRLIGSSAGRSLERSSDFKLLDRQVVDAVLECGERNRFFRGLVAWVGFRTTEVPFEVQARRAGETKWSSRGLLAYSLQNLVAFSSAPLRFVGIVGFATVGVGLLLALQTLYNYLVGISVSGFTTVILLMLILCGLILVSLGVIAFYLASMYEEQKQRPIFVIRRPRDDDGRDPATRLASAGER